MTISIVNMIETYPKYTSHQEEVLATVRQLVVLVGTSKSTISALYVLHSNTVNVERFGIKNTVL